MIVWNGADIVCFIIFLICFVVLGIIRLISVIFGKIDEYFERRNKNE